MRIPAVAITVLLLATPVIAQTTAPAPAAASRLNDQDRQFMVKDAQGGAYEIAIAALAQQRSPRDDVKTYAARVVADHAVYNQALQDLARAKGISLPTTMTADDQARLTSMRSQTGGGFDATFVQEAIRINAEDKQAASAEAARTSDPDLKAFLSKFESMDAEHERMAMALRR